MSEEENRGRRGQTGITGQTGQTGQPGQPGVSGTPGDIGETGPRGLQGVAGDIGLSPTGELLDAVKALAIQVSALTDRLTYYPTRREVKTDGRKRMWKALAFGVVLILLAQLFTVSMINYCFLGVPGQNEKVVCNIMPGYPKFVSSGNERIAQFEELLKTIDANTERSIESKAKVAKLEKQIKRLMEEANANRRPAN